MVLKSEISVGQTPVPNLFIEEYMPQASGTCIKVYLCLLRLQGQDFTVASLADMLDNAERDVIRALRYWKKQGLIALTEDEAGEITELSLLDIAAVRRRELERLREPHVPKTAEAKPEPAPAPAPAPEAPAEPAGKEKAAPTRRFYAPTEVEQLRNEEPAFGELVFAAEVYLARTLSPSETERFAYFHKDLEMPCDLLEYLVEYCVGLDKKSLRYIEKVALAWHERGWMTRKDAKEGLARFEEGKNSAVSSPRKGSKTRKNSFFDFDQRQTDLDAIVRREI